MENLNGTGVEYPTVELDGKQYTVKFSRGAVLYRLSKSGTSISDLYNSKTSFAAMVDILHAAIAGEYTGTVEQLADIISGAGQEKARECMSAVGAALGKAFPPTLPPQGAAEQTAKPS